MQNSIEKDKEKRIVVHFFVLSITDFNSALNRIQKTIKNVSLLIKDPRV